MSWYVALPPLFGYKISFKNVKASEKFSLLVDRWESSRPRRFDIAAGTKSMVDLQRGVLELVPVYQWEDDDVAFTEIDMLTSTFALLQ